MNSQSLSRAEGQAARDDRPGAPLTCRRPCLARSASSTWSTTRPTTSWCAPRRSSRTPSSRWTPRPSRRGTRRTTASSSAARARRPRSTSSRSARCASRRARRARPPEGAADRGPMARGGREAAGTCARRSGMMTLLTPFFPSLNAGVQQRQAQDQAAPAGPQARLALGRAVQHWPPAGVHRLAPWPERPVRRLRPRG